jgi:anti-anti-sigma factor
MDLNIRKYGILTLFNLSGVFSLRDVTEMDIAWTRMIEEAPGIVAFNCGDLEFIDSPAIGTLVKIVNQAKRVGIDVIFYNMSSAVDRIFSATRLDRIFPIMTEEQFRGLYLQDIPASRQ